MCKNKNQLNNDKIITNDFTYSFMTNEWYLPHHALNVCCLKQLICNDFRVINHILKDFYEW
jgi:hypothetical protein